MGRGKRKRVCSDGRRADEGRLWFHVDTLCILPVMSAIPPTLEI